LENKLDFKKTMSGIWAFVKKHQAGMVAVICAIILIAVLGWLSSLGIMSWSIETGLEGKTLWDWLQLAIVPIVLAVGALLFNRSEKKNEIKIAETRNKSDQDIATDKQREESLQKYIDKMTDLLLEKDLRESKAGDEIRVVAKTRTLATLRSIDPIRKGLLLQFLFEAKLIDKQDRICDLEDADLAGINLSGTDLKGVNLSGANLEQAILVLTDLREADLSYANLDHAKLGWAFLTNANMTGAFLESADLSNASLNQANLNDANLCLSNLDRAHLDEANLSKADLAEANLNKADLTGANLIGAQLWKTKFDGAILKDATVTDKQLSEASSLAGTTMADGTVHR